MILTCLILPCFIINLFNIFDINIVFFIFGIAKLSDNILFIELLFNGIYSVFINNLYMIRYNIINKLIFTFFNLIFTFLYRFIYFLYMVFS